MNNRIRYTLDEIQRNIYYQMPKFLFEGEFENLTNDARVLYSLLRDRHSLSIKNQWMNEDGEVYLIFSRENMCAMLKLSKPTVIKAMKDLKKYNLVEEKRLGQGKANHIYLLQVDTALTYEKAPQTLDDIEKEINFTSKGKDDFPEVRNVDFKTENNFISESHGILPQMVKNFYPSNIGFKRDLNINYNDSNHIESYRESDDQNRKEKTDMIRCDKTSTQSVEVVENRKEQKNKEGLENATLTSDQHLTKPHKPKHNVAEVEELIKENINYDYILMDNSSYKEMLDGILHVIVSTIVTDFKDGYISMKDENVPAELVKNVFFKLNKEDIEYFIENFNRQTDPTVKLMPYIRTSLYRNHGTNNFYWSNRVHVDMPQLAERKIHSKKVLE